MQPKYKIRKLVGCVNVNQKFHYTLRYTNQQLVKYCKSEEGGFNEG